MSACQMFMFTNKLDHVVFATRLNMPLSNFACKVFTTPHILKCYTSCSRSQLLLVQAGLPTCKLLLVTPEAQLGTTS